MVLLTWMKGTPRMGTTKIDKGEFGIECEGNVKVGDVILWAESTAPGRPAHQRSPFMRTIVAEVLSDSYGRGLVHHSFSLRVLASEGHAPLAPGHTIQRRVESIDRCGVRRRPWTDESQRPGAQKTRAGASAFPAPEGTETDEDVPQSPIWGF